MTSFLALLPGHVLDDAKRPLFLLLSGFIATFLVARLNTRLTRRHGRSHLRIGSVVTPGGLHVHHAVFGVIAMVVSGTLAFALRSGSPWLELMALAFGSGAALTLDEFALILHLEDVYWAGEGRKSIDAIILSVTFMTLLITGLLPATFNSLGDHITLSRWVLVMLILSGVLFVVVCYLKGKLFVGTVGIFVPPVAFVGAVRLGKPGSPWARWRYGARPAKLERARRRDEGFHQLWERRKNRLWDVIGGKPHHVLSSRDGTQRSHDALLSGGAAEDPGGPRV